jgi:hypothetical protein
VRKRDASVYVRMTIDGSLCFILVYVDDLLIVAKRLAEVE